MMLGGQEHPRDRQIGGWVARGDVAEVDHAAHRALVNQDVRRMQIGVQP
jgi:hypothetical protein